MKSPFEVLRAFVGIEVNDIRPVPERLHASVSSIIVFGLFWYFYACRPEWCTTFNHSRHVIKSWSFFRAISRYEGDHLKTLFASLSSACHNFQGDFLIQSVHAIWLQEPQDAKCRISDAYVELNIHGTGKLRNPSNQSPS